MRRAIFPACPGLHVLGSLVGGDTGSDGHYQDALEYIPVSLVTRLPASYVPGNDHPSRRRRRPCKTFRIHWPSPLHSPGAHTKLGKSQLWPSGFAVFRAY